MKSTDHVFSGIRATGKLHLGNYLGVVKGMLELQDKYDCIFAVVDLHTVQSGLLATANTQHFRVDPENTMRQLDQGCDSWAL